VSVISELKFTQSADVMTVCHNDYPPLEIRRYGEADWRTAASDNNQRAIPGPEHRRLGNCVRLRPNWIRNVDASSPIFKSQHVGKLFYMEQKAVDSVGGKPIKISASVTSADIRRTLSLC
jgi:hypothetical protein